MTSKERDALREVQIELAGASCGGIGADGPTIAEMQAYVEAEGMPYGDDDEYHVCQMAWRMIEGLLK